MALVSKDPNFVFIHIPKTAGISISNVLRKNKFKNLRRELKGKQGAAIHAGYSRINEVFPLNDFKTIAFIRNPWDRMFSFFYMITKHKSKKHPPRFRRNDADFKRWLLENKMYENKGKRFVPFHSRNERHGRNLGEKFAFMGYERGKTFQTVPQSYWLKDSEGKIAVDFIGRFENLQNDYKTVMGMVGINDIPELPHHHNGNKKSYKKVYDQEMIDFVAKHNKEDIEQFGFDF